MDYVPPFNISVNARTIAVLREGAGADSDKSITFSFYSQSLSAAAA
jgi:hypothetical protein